MVEVFITDVQLKEQASTLERKLLSQFPKVKIHFDLEDCDKVLRVEGKSVSSEKIIKTLNLDGYHCQVME